MTYELYLGAVLVKLAEKFAEAIAAAVESGGDESTAWRFASAAHRLVDRPEVEFVDVDAMDG